MKNHVKYLTICFAINGVHFESDKIDTEKEAIRLGKLIELEKDNHFSGIMIENVYIYYYFTEEWKKETNCSDVSYSINSYNV